MGTFKFTTRLFLPALLVTVAATAAWADNQNGYYVDHQQAMDRGGVGNYAPQWTGAGPVLTADETQPQSTDNTGRFLDHKSTVAMGGVGNYVTGDEAKRYDQKLAEEERLKNQVAMAEKQAPPAVSAASPDEGVVFFDTGKSTLTKDGKQEIAKLSSQLKDDPSSSIEVNGYTDDTGPNHINQKLSQARADVVQKELINNGVSISQIQTYSFGAQEPIASNDTSAGRSVNRRAELYIENGNATG